MTTIDFPHASQNQLKKWCRLTHAKFRREDGLFLAEGVKVVAELIKSDWQVETIITLPEKRDNWNPVHLPPTIPLYQLSRSDFKKLSQDKETEGILAVVRRKEGPSLKSYLHSAAGHVLIGHEIANPQNLGALLRTARWFDFAGIILGTYCVDWTHPKVVRASMGAVFYLNIFPDVDLAATLPEISKHFGLIGSDVRQGTAPHPQAGNAALLLGSESHGLPENLLEFVEERWHISGNSRSESLSLPQAAAIMMYEMTKKRIKA